MKILNIIGIGIFTFLSIYEFSGLMEYLSEQLLFINLPYSLSILWLPELIGLLAYLILLIWAINKIKNLIPISSSKTFAISIMIFFILLLVKFIYSFYGTGLLFERFPVEFDAFHKLRDENQQLQRIMGFFPILKYLILALILYFNKKLDFNDVNNLQLS
ncbi:hypothetical protein L3X39_06800 [Sabulilitoribacter multivorans]|uniref:Uncharacterized protein n=1 Tax=Flaviramulus multivorans TaxID=1304750 RepID=A0ABS9IIS4_9FLAO|nr:hypothetical protein [Flaviramulus multivorans]MCF7560345.1 hypothetical protein [Flaviramulus multivorans]